ncbi:MAG: MerR family transcriptional regulator [Acutalibacteraceae bacterium]|jgi:DNA-binding transcriptional MerR regulator/DNA-directed RNA polymerase subunit RPC12/RpoP|nr:MerR family transcriptional regulator [Acutalibacteraceae bacterium]
MAEYTTGEMAKLCGITVRTVQYYDNRSILVPSRLTEGGRRVYSENDLQKLKVICFLREIGMPINSIGELLSEEAPENVISMLLEQQEKALTDEIFEKQAQLDTIRQMTKEMKSWKNFSVDSITDIAHIMKNKKGLKKVRGTMLAVGFVMDAIEVSTFMLWIIKGIWVPFAIGMVLAVAMGVWISLYYFKNVEYICPECHNVFQPSLKEAFFANHTPKTRKLSCPKCNHKGFCVETYHEEKTENEKANAGS